MGSSTTTATLHLPQFADGDKPTWRGDVNGAFAAIDAAIATIDGQINTLNTEHTTDAAAIATINTALATIEAELPVARGALTVGNGTTAVPLAAGAVSQTLMMDSVGDPIWGLPTVEIEQFAGASDDLKMTAAITALLTTGGVIKLRPGKTYTWANAIPDFDFSANGKPIFLMGWGAWTNCDVAGAAFTCHKSGTEATTRTLHVFGGTWSNAVGDFFKMNDVANSFFYRCGLHTPNGSGVIVNNLNHYSERNHFVEIDDVAVVTAGVADGGCKHLISWTFTGGTASQARSLCRDIRLQNGTAWNAKLNIGDGTSVYGSIFDNINGNLSPNVSMMRIAGNMKGSVLYSANCECSSGTPGTDYAFYFTVGTMSGSNQTILQIASNITPLAPTPPAGSTITMQLVENGSGATSTQADLYNAVQPLPGVLGVGGVTTGSLGVNNGAANSDVAMTAATDTVVLTIPLTRGSWRIRAKLIAQITTANTAGYFCIRPENGTATASVFNGICADEVEIAANSTDVLSQVGSCEVDFQTTVSVAGNITINGYLSQTGLVKYTTPRQAFTRCSSFVATQIA